jgi:hypothetical protein
MSCGSRPFCLQHVWWFRRRYSFSLIWNYYLTESRGKCKRENDQIFVKCYTNDKIRVWDWQECNFLWKLASAAGRQCQHIAKRWRAGMLHGEWYRGVMRGGDTSPILDPFRHPFTCYPYWLLRAGTLKGLGRVLADSQSDARHRQASATALSVVAAGTWVQKLIDDRATYKAQMTFTASGIDDW